MNNFSITLRFEMDDYKFKDSDEFYNYLQEVFTRDKTVLRMDVLYFETVQFKRGD